jgi:DNA-directed RNA polymerase subunit M/transcription elongation factor TFIIS
MEAIDYPNMKDKKFDKLNKNRCAWCGNDENIHKSLPHREHGEIWIYCTCQECGANWAIKEN